MPHMMDDFPLLLSTLYERAAHGGGGAASRGRGERRGAPRPSAGRVAEWWLPDRVEFLEELPKTGTGKFDKKVLRDRYGDVVLED